MKMYEDVFFHFDITQISKSKDQNMKFLIERPSTSIRVRPNLGTKPQSSAYTPAIISANASKNYDDATSKKGNFTKRKS